MANGVVTEIVSIPKPISLKEAKKAVSRVAATPEYLQTMKNSKRALQRRRNTIKTNQKTTGLELR